MGSTIEHVAGTAPGCVGFLGASGQVREAVSSYPSRGTEVFGALSADHRDASARDQATVIKVWDRWLDGH